MAANHRGRGRWGATTVLPSLVLTTLVITPARAEVGYGVSAELGPELDSNATRVATDGDDEVRAGLLRLVADARLRWRGGKHRLALSYGGGAKLFLAEQARSADELVQRAQASWGAAAGRRGHLALLGSYYDAYQRESRQDFRTGTAAARLSLASKGRGTFGALELGYQGLEFKPFGDYSFHGLVGRFSAVTRVVPRNRADELAWRFGASYGLALRLYNGPVLADQRRDPCAEDPASPTCDQRRRDLAHRVRLWADYSGNAEARIWYGVEVNTSNSFGETFTRHAVGIKFTTLVGWGVFFSTKGVLRFSRFRDPFLLLSANQSRFVDIDDENRSTLLLRLSRDLCDHIGLAVRYTLHVNESTGGEAEIRPGGFVRHLLFFGVRVWLDSQDEQQG